ncbi:MAG: AraC family transcriptional regulator [Candidatus Limiplasma sp.]|nr:AraC family transcriptional regulator [Candidatus Limiplasma sp.]
MTENEWVQQLRLFHYSTRLPTHWLRNGQSMSMLPPGIVHAGMLMEESGPADLYAQLRLAAAAVHAVTHFSTPLEELFFCYKPSEGDCILCGPYCRADFQEKDVLRLIRSLHLRLDKQEGLRQYYASLPHLSEVNVHYHTLLLTRLLGGGADAPASQEAAEIPEDIPPRAYQSTYQNRMGMFRHPPYFFEEEISRQIVAANRTHALQLLGELNTLERARLADTPIRSLKNSLIGSVTLFTRAAIRGGVPSDEAFTMSDGFIQLIERQNDLAALSAIEEAILLRFVDSVAMYQHKKYSSLVRKAIAYMDEYLTEDLSAETLAAKVYVHPDYLASRFRQEVGETLHRYVLRRRVEEAAHFMRYSSESISDIAAFYRFSSQSHFISVFKKYMDMTPQQYRRQ